MKINIELIKKIFSRKLKITKNEDKKKLSKYEEYIPMYDIYSDKIYPIFKKNLYPRLIYSHYRFINQEINEWITNKYKKYKSENDKYNLDIIKNYDIDTLYDTSIRTVFKSSSEIGLQISICKRNSFNKYFLHNKPYYSKDELINLGLNMEAIKEKEIDNIDITDTKVHYDICKKISKNDVSFKEILRHSEYIIDSKLISLISFYSFMGSYFMNNLLRTEKIYDKTNPYYNMIQRLTQKMIISPKLDNEYFIYRFIWDDFFIRNLKIGEVFEDKGFISTTRDPFYSPQNEIKFGVVLAKIKIKPSTAKCLLIENFSLFPKEEEILLVPNSRIKLVSKNENFKYYHVNKNYEKNITKKYEFELIGNNFKEDKLLEESISYVDLNIESNNDNIFVDKIGIIDSFIKKYKKNSEKIKFENYLDIKYYSKHLEKSKNYRIFYHWFDGTDSYDLFYKNKNKDGMFFIIYDEFNYPYINIEFGDEMIINNLNKFYYYDDKKNIDLHDFLLITELARIFRYSKFQINGEYNNFSSIIPTEENEEGLKIASYCNLYCKSFYDYLKNNKKFYEEISKDKLFKNIPLFNLKFGYWKIDKLEQTDIPDELYNKFDENIIKAKNLKDFIIEIIEKHFFFYKKLKEYYNDMFDELYIDFDVNLFFRNVEPNDTTWLNQDIPYSSNLAEEDKNFKMIFRQPVRRIV